MKKTPPLLVSPVGGDLSALQKGEEGFFTGLVEKSLLKEKILADFCPKNLLCWNYFMLHLFKL